MGAASRLKLIAEIESIRGSKVICYLTSIRPGVQASIGDDQVRVFFDHLLEGQQKPIDKLDIFLCSNGGAGTVPWRLISLFREFAKSFSVLVPYRAYSAATLLSLGADEIVMHPFGELGPIDPTVANEFNPKNQAGQPIGINVEDVTAYVNFIKSTVGITHEDELVQVIKVLAENVHPLALGNVERFLLQSRMIARKILRTHMKDDSDDHTVAEIVENLASKLYFHGHPINRHEAKTELKLKVAQDVKPELETAMWQLYKEYEVEFRNGELFDPFIEFVDQGKLPAPQVIQGPSGPTMAGHLESIECDHVLAMIESVGRTSTLRQRQRLTVTQVVPAYQVMGVTLSLEWENSVNSKQPDDQSSGS